MRPEFVQFAIVSGLQSESGVSEFAYTGRLEMFAEMILRKERGRCHMIGEWLESKARAEGNSDAANAIAGFTMRIKDGFGA